MPTLTHGPSGSVLDVKSGNPLQFKVLNEEQGIFEALCNTTGIVDSVADIMEPGVFKGSLQNRKPKILRDHIWENVIGKVVQAEELMPGDPRLPMDLQAVGAGALYVRGQINTDTQIGKDAWSDLKFFGDETEFSIGFTIPNGGSSYDSKSGIRKVTEVDLMEVSVVLWGASPGTRTLSLKQVQGKHSTPVSDAPWNAESTLKNLQKRPLAENYRKAFAWTDKPSDDILDYSYAHHFVSDQGVVGAASAKACLAQIDMLNDPECEFSEEDRKGIFAHLSQHMIDGGLEVPELKNFGPDESKGVVSYKKTDTSDSPWDGPTQKANLKNDAGASVYKQAFAWVDSSADAEKKSNYKFIHHFVSSSGDVGAASTVACSAGIAVLNGGRSGTTIPDADRKGVHAHLAHHLKDAGQKPPTLKTLEELDDIKETPDTDQMVPHQYAPPEGATDNADAPCLVCGEPADDPIHDGYKAMSPYKGPAGTEMPMHQYDGATGDPTATCNECGMTEQDGNHTMPKTLEEKPYHIEEHNDKYCVVNSDTGKEVNGGCHATRADAVDHLRALYANVEDAKSCNHARQKFDNENGRRLCKDCGEDVGSVPENITASKDLDNDSGTVGATDSNPDPDNDGDDDRVSVPHLFFPLYGNPAKCAICRNAKKHKLHTTAEHLSLEAVASANCNKPFTVEMLGAKTIGHCEKIKDHTDACDFDHGEKDMTKTNNAADELGIEIIPAETDTEKAQELEEELEKLNSQDLIKSLHDLVKDTLRGKDLDPATAALLESIDSQVDALMDTAGVDDEDESDSVDDATVDGPEDVSALALQALDAQVDLLLAVFGLDDLDEDKTALLRDTFAAKIVQVTATKGVEELRLGSEEPEVKLSVSLAGSFEDTASKVSEALQNSLPAPADGVYQSAWVEATFPDSVLVCVVEYTDDGEGLDFVSQKYFSYPYTNEAGAVSLGDPTEVEPKGVLVAKDLEEVITKTASAIEEKIGRTLSSDNLGHIRLAVEALNEVLASGTQTETEDEAKEEATETAENAEVETEELTGSISMAEIMAQQLLSVRI